MIVEDLEGFMYFLSYKNGLKRSEVTIIDLDGKEPPIKGDDIYLVRHKEMRSLENTRRCMDCISKRKNMSS
uniref:Uncharacterized protein n=1 Tax=Lepeophtheirus salmonis TaxID=72036 RepID=A0A0K2U614_LEPSM